MIQSRQVFSSSKERANHLFLQYPLNVKKGEVMYSIVYQWELTGSVFSAMRL